MVHADLFPAASELADLQLALDTCQLTENELLLLLAVGPRLAKSVDPMDALAAVVLADAQADGAALVPNDMSHRALATTIERANPLQRRALAIVALQKTWSDEGATLRMPGLTAE